MHVHCSEAETGCNTWERPHLLLASAVHRLALMSPSLCVHLLWARRRDALALARVPCRLEHTWAGPGAVLVLSAGVQGLRPDFAKPRTVSPAGSSSSLLHVTHRRRATAVREKPSGYTCSAAARAPRARGFPCAGGSLMRGGRLQ